MSNKINDKDVELYLLKNTDFFLTRESIVSELDFKHSPGKAESLLERQVRNCLLYTSPSPRDVEESRMPSSA